MSEILIGVGVAYHGGDPTIELFDGPEPNSSIANRVQVSNQGVLHSNSCFLSEYFE